MECILSDHAKRQLARRTDLRIKTINIWLKKNCFVVLPGICECSSTAALLMWDCFGHQPVLLVIAIKAVPAVVKTVYVPNKHKRWNGYKVTTDQNIKLAREMCSTKTNISVGKC